MRQATCINLIRAISANDLDKAHKLVDEFIKDERDNGRTQFADTLEKIVYIETTNYRKNHTPVLHHLPRAQKDSKTELLKWIDREDLKHHMVLSPPVESRIVAIEDEWNVRDKLKQFGLAPKRKILLYGTPGNGKTMSAERIAWDLGLPLMKVRFDSIISSYLGESASNLRSVFDFCEKQPCVLLLDECDFIAKSRTAKHEVGEIPRITNMLLSLLDEYNADGIIIATTNLKTILDHALFRRFDDVIEIPMLLFEERKRLLEMTLSAINVDYDIDTVAKRLDGHCASEIVEVAKSAMKICVMDARDVVTMKDFDIPLNNALLAAQD